MDRFSDSVNQTRSGYCSRLRIVKPSYFVQLKPIAISGCNSNCDETHVPWQWAPSGSDNVAVGIASARFTLPKSAELDVTFIHWFELPDASSVNLSQYDVN